MVAAGWREHIWRYASHLLMLVLLAVVVALSRVDVSAWRAPQLPPVAEGVNAASIEDVAVVASNLSSEPPTFGPVVAEVPSLSRGVEVHTLIATRGRTAVLTYTVQAGDTLFGIAERFNLKPETLLWGNFFTLKDDPHTLQPGQVLNILPIDGTYHYVTAGNTLEQIAKFYNVAPEAIASWPSNNLGVAGLTLTPNTYLVVPGGTRALQSWQLPSLPRTAQASARAASNFGQCPGGYTGIIGSGTLVWPTLTRTLSGYDYTSIHRGIDIRAKTGDPIAAVDAGVVTYAGWNDWGYGNLVVIDHGTGWESVYAHLSQWNVQCGQSVNQGELIGLAGSTGRSSGPHLHFELRNGSVYVNPWSVLP
jgi:murein DD-endopeptidase MepM/ murein hydrolase activator NlpD